MKKTLTFIDKLILKLIYPFWYFFAKIWIGAILIMCFVPVITAGMISLLIPDLTSIKGE